MAGRGSGHRHKISGVEQIAFDGLVLGGGLPLEFRGEPESCPARVGVGLEVADLADWRRFHCSRERSPRRVKRVQVVVRHCDQ